MNQIDLASQVAIVTGAARGIGLAIAERLLHSGADVSLWDRDAGALRVAADHLQSLGRVHTAAVDITDFVSIEAAAADVVQRFGTVHILVNNAGIAGANKPSWELSIDEWRQVIDIDLTGVFLCCKAVVPRLIAEKRGRVVNIASIAGKEGNPNAAHYSAAKAGVIGFTKSLGKELAKTGVIANCVTPAVIQTDIFAQMAPQHIDYMLSRTGAVFDLSGGRATY